MYAVGRTQKYTNIQNGEKYNREKKQKSHKQYTICYVTFYSMSI